MWSGSNLSHGDSHVNLPCDSGALSRADIILGKAKSIISGAAHHGSHLRCSGSVRRGESKQGEMTKDT